MYSPIIELPTGEICFLNGQYLFFYDNVRFKKVKLPSGVGDFSTGNGIFYSSLNNQVVVFAMNENYVYHHAVVSYDIAKKSFIKINFPLIAADFRFSPSYFDDAAQCYYGVGIHNNGIAEDAFRFKNGKYEKLFENESKEGISFNKLNDKLVSFNFYDKQNNWQTYIKNANGEFEQWYYFNSNQELKIVKPIKEDHLIFSGSKVYYLEKNRKEIRKIGEGFGAGERTASSKNRKLLWMATEKGLLQFTNNGIQYFDEKDAEYIWSVTEDNQKNIWMLPYGTPMKVFDGKIFRTEKRHENLFPFIGPTQSFVNKLFATHFYYSPFKDKHGGLWLPNETCQIRYSNGKFERINKMPAYFNMYDSENDYVFQGSGKGIYVFSTTKPKEILFLEGGKDLLLYGNYMFLFKDSKKRYWLGGWGGMNRFESIADVFNKKSKEYSHAKKNVPFRGFATMFEDRDGIIWTGTTDGLYYYQESTDSWKQVLPKQIKKVVGLIGAIDEHKLIVGVEEGLMILDRHKLKVDQPALVKLYNYHNGFEGLEPGQNGLFKDSKGRLWVTSGSVLSVIEPGKLDLQNDPLVPYFDKLNSNGNSLLANSEPIVSSENVFRIEVGATGFNRPLNTQFSFKINDKSWTPWQTSTEFFIPALANGSHQIQLRAKTDGILEVSLKPANIILIVDAPFYKSPNFAMYLGAICTLLFGYFFYAFFKSKYEKRKLAEKEKQINYLQIQTLQAQLNPHFLFNALSSLQNLILKKETTLANNSLTKLASLYFNKAVLWF